MPAPILDARRTLGLGAEKITLKRIQELRRTRRELARRTRSTSSRTQPGAPQIDLEAFDAALALVVAEWEASGADHRRLPLSAILFLSLWFLVVAAGTVGWTRYLEIQHSELVRDARIRGLETLGWQYIDNRRWKEADTAFSAITQFLPGSELPRIGHARTAAGRKEEETQFIAYWTGQALAELEAGRLDEASVATRRVLDSYPWANEAASILQRIDAARLEQQIRIQTSEVRASIDHRDWHAAAASAQRLATRYPTRPDIADLLQEALAGRERAQRDESKADSLYQLALARNTGQFDQQALDWLREAATLSPGRKDIATLLETMASYTRTLRVPEDHATPDEALANARDNDRIVLGKGTWRGPLLVNHSIELQGAGPGETILTCSAEAGNAITIHAANVRISGIAFRHDSLLIEHGDRFSAATVTHGTSDFVNCRFCDSNGHGLVVIQGASATIRRCVFRENAWNGVAAIGNGSTIRMEESESSGNFHNGVETWNGASANLKHNRITANTRNGIHADQTDAPLTCENNVVTDNREFGITLTSAKNGHLSRNQSRKNLLGGILIRNRASTVTVTDNESTGNAGPDLVLESGLAADAYAQNTLTRMRADALHAGAKIDP